MHLNDTSSKPRHREPPDTKEPPIATKSFYTQETHLYKGKSSPLRRQIDYNWTQTKNTGQPNTTTRKSPSQTCVSPEETAKQTAKQQTKTKNGARAQTKTPTKSICHGTQWLVHCIIIKNVPMNSESRLSGKHEGFSLRVYFSISQAVQESRATN